MAEFLGLGITFAGIDKGLNKSLKESQTEFSNTRDEIEETEKASMGGGKKGGIFSGIVEGVKLLSIGQIGTQLEDFSEGLAGTEKQVDDVFKSLDTLEAKIGSTFDHSSAMQFRGAIDGIMLSSGVTADNAEALALGMVKFGRSTEESVKALPMMGKLVGVLGLEADRVAQMYGSGLAQLRATPKQLDKIVKQTVKLQKSYGLTDQVSVLPEIFETVTANAAKFGKVNTEAALRSTMGISRLSAVFQKLGKSQDQAVSASVGFENTLSDMRTAILDMQVGLPANTESLNDLAEALAIAGVQDPFGAITENFDSVEDMSKFLRSSLEGLDERTKLAVTQRLRRVFGDDVTNMVGAYGEDAEAAVKAADKQAAQLGTSEEEFAKFEKTMENTVDVQERMRDSAKQLLEITLQRATKPKLMSVLNDERNAYIQLNKAVGDQNSLLGKSLLLFHQLKSLGLRALFDNELISMASIFLGVLGGFIFPLTQLVGLFTILKAPIMAAVGSLFLLAKPIALGVAAIAGLGLAVTAIIKNWDSLTAAIGGFVSIFKEGGLGAVWDSFVEGAKNAFMAIPRALEDMWKKALNAMPDFVKNFIGLEVETAPKLTQSMLGTAAQEKQSEPQSGVSSFMSSLFGNDEEEMPQSPGQVGANVFTSSMQQGAPSNMRSAISLPPEPRREVADENFQALIDEMSSMKKSLIDALRQLAGSQEVNVQITGEMAKFLRAVKQDNRNVAGVNGISHAVSR